MTSLILCILGSVLILTEQCLLPSTNVNLEQTGSPTDCLKGCLLPQKYARIEENRDGIAQKQELHAAVFVSDLGITPHGRQTDRAPVSVDALESPLVEVPLVESSLVTTAKTSQTTTSAESPAVTNTKEPVRHLRVSVTEHTEDLTTSPSARTSSRHLATAGKGSRDDKPNTFWLVAAVLFVPCILCIIVSVRYAWRDEYRDS